MNRHVASAAFLAAALAAAPLAAEVAPGDIVWAEDGSIAESLTGTPGNAEEGQKVMTTNALGNCVACHQISTMPEVPFHGTIAPELEGAAERWSEAQLRGIVVDAKKTFPESFMPGMYKVGPFIRVGDGYKGTAPEGGPESVKPILTAQQVEDVVAYLMTLK